MAWWCELFPRSLRADDLSGALALAGLARRLGIAPAVVLGLLDIRRRRAGLRARARGRR